MLSNQDIELENDKDLYFLILNPSELNIDFKNLKYVSNISPSIIFNKTIEISKGNQLEEIVFKFTRRKKKKDNKDKKKDGEKEYIIKYISGDHSIIISFDAKKKSFVYSPELSIGNIYLDNIPEPIEQNIIPLYNKLNIFQEALEKNNESNKKEKLFKDSIDLYEKKKKFSLLTTLFLKIYENKELCDKLMEIFYKINDKENIDKENDLKKDLQTFKCIYSKAQEIIDEKKYNPIYFYGLLFSYLHYYDKNHFSEMIKKFSEGNADDLYEILIQYHSHFMNPLNQSQQFFNGFIQYVIKKENKFEIFKRAMKYIKDIETYIFVINENKNQIFDKYKELKIKPIELGPTLKLIKYNIDKCFTGEKTNSDNESDEEDNTEGLNRLQAVECECDKIIELIEKLIKFSEKERTLAIYLKVTFWINLIKQYDIPDWENINNLHKLRELFKKYNNLINFLYEEKNEDDTKDKKNKKKIKKEGIKYEINGYLERDEFALNLNKNIKGFFEKAKDRLTNAEILGTVANFNPFFSIKNQEDKEKFKNKRDTYIFDYIKFNKTTPTFILNFKKWNFEIIFEEIISDYINKITGKIKDIQTFGNIIKLIEVNRIKEEEQKDYFRILKEKYKNVIENEIKNINKEEELGKAISIIAEFVSKLFSYEKNNSFIDERIKKLDDKIKSLIYIEIITKYNGDEYQKMKNYIYDIYLNNLGTKEGRDNVIKLVKKLTGEEKKFFTYEKLLKKCVFTKEEFFSNHKNYKIKTLCELKKELEKEQLEKETKKEGENEEEKYLDIPALSEKGNESAKILSNTLDDIIQDLDNEKIIKKDLEKFLRIKKMKNQQKDKEDANKKQEEINTSSKRKEPQAEKQNEPTEKTEEDEVIEKLGLISLVLNQYNPEIKYAEYKQIIENINKTVDKLNLIKDSLMIFHKNKFNKDIDAITGIIKEIENNPIINFKNEERQKGIKAFEKHDPLCDEINKVKDFLLFKKIFENAQGSDQLERFEDATKKLSALKGKLTLKENSNENTLKEKSNEDMLNIELIFKEKDFKNVLKDIKDELSRKDESKSELFAKQMIDYFNITNKSVIKDLKMLINSKKYENILISIDYFFKNFSDKKVNLPNNKNLSDLPLDILKSTLNQLKNEDIYNHESSSQYYKIYTAMYEKKEAIDFLIKNINKERDLRKKLIKNLDPTNRSISIKDINDTIKCLEHFNKLINKNSSEIMKYIKSLNEDEIKQFVSYSKKFGSIIGLYNKTGKDNFSEVYEIVKDASLIFNLDGEDFKYKDSKGEDIKIKNIEELIKLKSRINLQPKQKKEENKDKKEEKKEIKVEKEKDEYED